nr:hypothetical protein [Tanacetum cinerariifolium]
SWKEKADVALTCQSLVVHPRGSRLLWGLRGSIHNDLRCIYLILLSGLFQSSLLLFVSFLTMSRKNLSTVTCSLAQDDLVDFVEEYGISLCYDPKLPKPAQMALDTPDGYIPLYWALFTLGNLYFPLNSFCLDVFEFFWCHFPLWNAFGVARVTTFVVACKAYGGEATVPIFRAFLTLGSAGDWLTFQKRPGPDIHTFFKMAFHNFMKKLGQPPSFFIRPSNLPIDVGSPSMEPLRHHGEGDVKEEEKPEAPRRISAKGSVPPPPVTIPKGAGKHPRMMARFVGSLANSSDSLAPDVEKSHAAHNVVSSLHCPLLKDKLGFLRFDELVDAQKNQDAEGIQIVKDLRSENAQVLEEVSILRNVAASAEDSQRELYEELNAIVYGRSQALDEVHGLGDSWDLYHPKAEKLFNEASEAFYKLEFPYISLLSKKADQSLEELSSVEAPSIQETPDLLLEYPSFKLCSVVGDDHLWASGKGPTVSIPHWMKGHAAVTEVISFLGIRDTGEWI